MRKDKAPVPPEASQDLATACAASITVSIYHSTIVPSSVSKPDTTMVTIYTAMPTHLSVIDQDKVLAVTTWRRYYLGGPDDAAAG
jgi:hypothetical protein